MRADARGFCGLLLAAGAAAGIAYTALAIDRLVRFRRETQAAPDTPATLPPMTILKPLCGDETHLFENLRSFCDQDYPAFQVIFGAQDADDPAIPIVHRVIDSFPNLDLQLVAGGRERAVAANPKIANLAAMLPSAKYDLLVIADSDIRVGRDYLTHVAAAFAHPQTGAVTCLYGATPIEGAVSQLGAMYVNDQFSPSVLVALALEPLTYCFGATMAVRRSVLDEIGALAALTAHLGDDYLLGNLVSRAGHAVVLAPCVVQTTVAERDLSELWRRELRWARTIRAARPAGFAGSILTYAVPLSVLFALFSRRHAAAGAMVGLAAALRVALHAEARKTFAPHVPATPWLIPLRDALGVAIWGASFFGNRVLWRSKQYDVRSTRGSRARHATKSSM